MGKRKGRREKSRRDKYGLDGSKRVEKSHRNTNKTHQWYTDEERGGEGSERQDKDSCSQLYTCEGEKRAEAAATHTHTHIQKRGHIKSSWKKRQEEQYSRSS